MTFATVAVQLLFLAAAVFAPAAAVDCNGELTKSVDGDVYVANGSTCYLRDKVTISGSVYLNSGGNLESTGSVAILGKKGILGINGGYVNLGGSMRVGKIDLLNGSYVTLEGTTVFKGELKVEASTGDLTICNSRLADVVEYKENEGSFISYVNWWAVKGLWGCTKNIFMRDVKIEAISGDVYIVGSNVLPGELDVKLIRGNLLVKDASVAKAKIELNTGSVTMQNVRSKETEFKDNSNGVSLINSIWGKLNCVGNSPDVTGYGNESELPEGQCAESDIFKD